MGEKGGVEERKKGIKEEGGECSKGKERGKGSWSKWGEREGKEGGRARFGSKRRVGGGMEGKEGGRGGVRGAVGWRRLEVDRRREGERKGEEKGGGEGGRERGGEGGGGWGGWRGGERRKKKGGGEIDPGQQTPPSWVLFVLFP